RRRRRAASASPSATRAPVAALVPALRGAVRPIEQPEVSAPELCGPPPASLREPASNGSSGPSGPSGTGGGGGPASFPASFPASPLPGPGSGHWNVWVLLRGAGVSAVKSALLSFVSAQPLPPRIAAFVASRAGACPPSESVAAP